MEGRTKGATMIDLKCNNLFCDHPWALGFGFLVLAILVILLLFESFHTGNKRRGSGGGDHPQDTRPPGFGAEQSYDEPLVVKHTDLDGYVSTSTSIPVRNSPKITAPAITQSDWNKGESEWQALGDAVAPPIETNIPRPVNIPVEIPARVKK
jgi:hypothetical protein